MLDQLLIVDLRCLNVIQCFSLMYLPGEGHDNGFTKPKALARF